MLGALNLHEVAGTLEGSLISGDLKLERFLGQFKSGIKRVTTGSSVALPEDGPIMAEIGADELISSTEIQLDLDLNPIRPGGIG